MNSNFFKKASLGISAVIIAGILAVVNFFSYNIFYRFDLTQNNDYSISKTSKNTVANLDDIVNIKAYFSENLPAQYINLRQEVGDILDEYVSYSKGNVKLEFIDPKDDKAIQQELYQQGIPQLQFNVLEKDKYQVVNGYMGLSIQYGDKKEIIPVIQDTNNFEYQITSSIKKVTGKIQAVIGFVTSGGCSDPDSEITAAYKKLEELYDVQKVDLAQAGEVPSSITTLIIASPKQVFSESEQKKIDDFLMRGKSILLLQDGVTVGQGLQATPNETDLDKLFAKYGFELKKDLILDMSSGMASFSQGFLSYALNYPFWPKVIKGGFDKDNAAVSKLESLVLPWVSSVEISDSTDKGNKISILAKTTSDGWRIADNFNLNPQTVLSTKNESKQYSVAVSASGRFTSAFGDKSTDQARIAVVGDGDFITDSFLRNAPDNLVFFQNVVDSLSLDEDLINIRSSGVSERPIKELSEGAKAGIRYANIFGLTVIVVAFGVIRYYLRKRTSIIDQL